MSDADFIEDNYLKLIKLAMKSYKFSNYTESSSEPLVVWRHDIDYSPNRALALARIEAEQRVSCNYHIMISSRYYNIFEQETLSIAKEIVKLGHNFGLHFDIESIGNCKNINSEKILNRIATEKDIIENLLETKFDSISFHNTILNSENIIDKEELLGMVNVNAKSIFESYKYVSDSNGIWRNDRLEDVLIGETHQRLHVLTHPVWWTKDVMPPAQRLRRAIEGRANRGMDIYFDLMKRDGRYDEVYSKTGFGIHT